MRCTFCGEKLPRNSERCESCGGLVQPELGTYQALQSTRKKRMRVLKYCISGCALCACACAGIMLIDRDYIDRGASFLLPVLAFVFLVAILVLALFVLALRAEEKNNRKSLDTFNISETDIEEFNRECRGGAVAIGEYTLTDHWIIGKDGRLLPLRALAKAQERVTSGYYGYGGVQNTVSLRFSNGEYTGLSCKNHHEMRRLIEELERRRLKIKKQAGKS